MRRFAVCLVVATTLAATEGEAMNEGFVTVAGGQFQLNGQPFRFVGTNAYYMQTMTAYGNPAYTDDTLAMAKALGMTVIRPFAFSDGDRGVAAMQTGPGVYQESGLRALDYVLHKADIAGIRLILPLVNGQDVWGGPKLYSQWCGGGDAQRPFYEMPACRTLFKQWITMLLNRVNTYNGRRYKDDPTVFAWELANEPHLEAEYSGAVIRAWVADIAAFIKANDPNHLVSTGEEGYDVTTQGYSSVATTYKGQSWLLNGQKGLQWTDNTRDPHIDYGSIHLYPEHWNLDRNGGRAWIVDHVRIARAMGKPLVVGEFGWSADPAGAADEWLTAWDVEGGAGALFWQLMPQVAYGMRDHFGVPYPPDSPVSDVLARFAAWVAPGQALTFTVGAGTATPAQATPGQTVRLTVPITASLDSSGHLVDLGIWSEATGNRVKQVVRNDEAFQAGQAKTFTVDFAVPSTLAPGVYGLSTGIFSAAWATLFTWADSIVTFRVQALAPPAPPSALNVSGEVQPTQIEASVAVGARGGTPGSPARQAPTPASRRAGSRQR
jgi:mannan endo-1,4-beta-mannosidase